MISIGSKYKDKFAKIDWSKHEPYVPSAPTPVARGDFPCPRVIGDSMDPVQHVDGKHYDSKSAFRAVTKREGYVEVGNDPARHKLIERPTVDPKARRQAIEKATAQVLGS